MSSESPFPSLQYFPIQAMELFTDASNSPLPLLPELFDLKLRSITSMEDALSAKLDCFFDDQDFRKHTPHEKEDFILDINENDIRDVQVFDVTKKIKKTRRKPDYKKNICGYITKRIIREFVSERYQEEVRQLCKEGGCSVEEVKEFFLSRIEAITGPRHLEGLFRPRTSQDVPLKRVFICFFDWFLKERYVRYLVCDGKMVDKRAYVEYKNTVIVRYIHRAKRYLEKLADTEATEETN